MATETGSGGADAFLKFLAVTLWPELARRDHYDVLPDAFRAGLVALFG